MQAPLIMAWTNPEKFELGTDLLALLFTILRDTYYTALVGRRREVRDEAGAYTATLTSPANQDWSLAFGTLEAALRCLPNEHREALILVSGGGLIYEEAAAIFGCALGAIKRRINPARNHRAKFLDIDMVDEDARPDRRRRLPIWSA